ncbi:M50 family metallopeptidase [Solicola gregarius]|uniref:M50 family metallopeptidase n=1 Tax=Solicola gregarius TaxID=2908642 RepID=A0AA46TG40_9ACTN|nr:M50 family metallopeptidase [Solicola gregarius]UYM04461.1 M50 family metallopeptidase [Solicola gregarius]
MEGLIYALGVVIFIVGVIVSIALHEVGHMLPAKKFGIKVTQYFVGFGKTVWSVRRGETEYGFKAIPLGGFVKMVGMLPPHQGDDPTTVRKTNTGMFTQLISDARSSEYEHVGPDDEDRLFYRKPWWQKLIVMSGGPLVNIGIALVLFTIAFTLIGAQKPTTTVNSVSACAIPADRDVQTCQPGDPKTPANEAGLEPGDQVVSFDGTAVTDWDQLTELIRDNGGDKASIVIDRGGEQRTKSVETIVEVRPSLDEPEQYEEVGFLGISPTTEYERQDLGFVLSTMGDYTKATGEAILHLPQKMVEVADAAFGGERKDDSPMSVVGAGRVAGEMVTVDDTTWTDRAFRLITLIAAVNLFIALFNFIPLLPLDGGHIAGALYEALRRGFAKVIRKPDPGYVDVAKMLPVAYVVGALLLVMGVLLIYADIVNPVTLT